MRVEGDERLRARFGGFDWAAAASSRPPARRSVRATSSPGPGSGSSRAWPPGASVEVEVDGHRRARAARRPREMRSSSTGTAPSPRATRSTSCSQEFGDATSSTRRGGARARAHAARGHRARVRDDRARRSTRLSSGCSRTSGVRAGLRRVRSRAHDPLVVSSGFHELIEPLLAREGIELQVRREPARRAARRLAGGLPRATAVPRSAASRASAPTSRASTGSPTSATGSPTAASRSRRRASSPATGSPRYLAEQGVAFEPLRGLPRRRPRARE